MLLTLSPSIWMTASLNGALPVPSIKVEPFNTVMGPVAPCCDHSAGTYIASASSAEEMQNCPHRENIISPFVIRFFGSARSAVGSKVALLQITDQSINCTYPILPFLLFHHTRF